MLRRYSVVSARRDHDELSSREAERAIYLLVLDHLQYGRCHRESGESHILSFWERSGLTQLQIQLALNFDRRGGNEKGPAKVTDNTYIGFMVLTFLGACLSWTLIDAKHVLRRDGSRIILMKHPTWQSEIFGLWETLRTDPYIILLFPMFFASNWFYTYQFQDVNYARFTVRTRALNNALYWLAQIFGAGVFGFALDFPNVRRTKRAKIAWSVMFLLTFGVWGGGYVFQRQYSRDDGSPHFDWTDSGYGGPMVLYISYGFYDAAWQTCVYWYVSFRPQPSLWVFR